MGPVDDATTGALESLPEATNECRGASCGPPQGETGDTLDRRRSGSFGDRRACIEMRNWPEHCPCHEFLRDTARQARCRAWEKNCGQAKFRAEPGSRGRALCARESVLKEDFVKVGVVGDLAVGKMMRVRVGARRILLANVDGHYFATDDTCTHEEASLSTGSLHGEYVKCPLHGSRFSVCTGQVRDEPASVDLKTYPVRVQDESIWIGLTGAER